MPSKSVLKKGFSSKAERISEEYRKKLGISKFDPLDAFKLANHLNIPIVGVDDFNSEIGTDHINTLRDLEKFSAMWMTNKDSHKIIIHNNYHSPKRQQSNLMHELAHIILEHKISDEQIKLCALLGLTYYNTLHEQEAKYLGGCLQITRPGLQWALKQNYSKERMSEYYNASVDMVTYRLNITGVLKQHASYYS